MRPSFPTEIAITDTSQQTEAVFEGRGNATSLLAVVEAFETAARLGMFSKQYSSLTPLQAEELSPTVEWDVRRRWELGGLHLGAFRALLNMLELADRWALPVLAVRLTSDLRGRHEITLSQLLAVSALEADKVPPFEVILRADPDHCEDPVIRLKFDTPVSDNECATLDGVLRAWDAVVAFGGFLDNVNDWDDNASPLGAIEQRQTYLASALIVEHLFYRFIGTRSALDALVCLATRLHFEFRPIVSLEIE